MKIGNWLAYICIYLFGAVLIYPILTGMDCSVGAQRVSHRFESSEARIHELERLYAEVEEYKVLNSRHGKRNVIMDIMSPLIRIQVEILGEIREEQKGGE